MFSESDHSYILFERYLTSRGVQFVENCGLKIQVIPLIADSRSVDLKSDFKEFFGVNLDAIDSTGRKKLTRAMRTISLVQPSAPAQVVSSIEKVLPEARRSRSAILKLMSPPFGKCTSWSYVSRPWLNEIGKWSLAIELRIDGFYGDDSRSPTSLSYVIERARE